MAASTDDALVAALFTSSRLADNCRNVYVYATKLLEGQEDTRAFHKFLPRLLKTVLGPDSRNGWVHQVKTETESKALYSLLCTRGPLFCAILLQNDDPTLRYEILSNKLPNATMKRVAGTEGTPNMLINRIQLPDTQSRAVAAGTTTPSGVRGQFGGTTGLHGLPAIVPTEISVKLTLVEYYLFWFLYLGLGERDTSGGPGSDSGHRTPGAWSKGFSTLLENAHLSPLSPTSASDREPPSFGSLYTNLVQDYLNFFVPLPSAANDEAWSTPRTPQPKEGRRRHEWFVFSICVVLIIRELGTSPARRCEVGMSLAHFFTDAIAEMWLAQNRYDFDRITRMPAAIQGYVMPTPEITRLVLLYLRHTMRISITWTADVTNNIVLSSILQVRKRDYDVRQRPLYELIQLGLAFATDKILEKTIDIWLQSLQPWKIENKAATYSPAWQAYVLDHYLFYQMPFFTLLARMTRTSRVNMDILDRTMAVFSSDTKLLEELLMIERSLEGAGPMGTSPGAFGAIGTLTMRRFSLTPMGTTPTPESPVSGRGLTPMEVDSIRTRFRATERPSFEWRPMFTVSSADPVSTMLRLVDGGIRRESEVQRSATARPRVQTPFEWFHISPSKDSQKIEQSMVSLRRLQQIRRAFELLFPKTKTDPCLASVPTSADLANAPGSIYADVRPDTGMLTDEAKMQIREGKRKCTNMDVSVRGNADDHLVRSYENATLVRWSVTASVYLNHQLPPLIERVFGAHAPAWTRQINLRPIAAYSNLMSSALLVLLLYVLWQLVRLFV